MLPGDHSTLKPANELEIACTIAKMYQHQEVDKKNLKKAMEQAGASNPACKGYLQAVGEFVSSFSGGDDFPLLMVLQSISALAKKCIIKLLKAQYSFSKLSSLCLFFLVLAHAQLRQAIRQDMRIGARIH